jgi:hypothetical protein
VPIWSAAASRRAGTALDRTPSSRLVRGRSKAVSPSLQDFATRTPKASPSRGARRQISAS